MADTDLNPNSLTMLRTETLPINVEWADALASSDTITALDVQCIDNANNVTIPNAFSATLGYNGTQSQFIIQGQYLQVGHSYTLIFGASIGNQKHLQQTLTLRVAG